MNPLALTVRRGLVAASVSLLVAGCCGAKKDSGAAYCTEFKRNFLATCGLGCLGKAPTQKATCHKGCADALLRDPSYASKCSP